MIPWLACGLPQILRCSEKFRSMTRILCEPDKKGLGSAGKNVS